MTDPNSVADALADRLYRWANGQPRGLADDLRTAARLLREQAGTADRLAEAEAEIESLNVEIEHVWIASAEKLLAERDETRSRLNTARFVADTWRAHMVAADQPVAIAAHPLCMVLAALDGETDPEQLGLDPEDAPALTAAVQPPDPKEPTDD